LPDKTPVCEPRDDLFVVPLVQLTPRIWLLRFPVVNAYIVQTTEGVALIDSGSVGCDPDVIGALGELGAGASDLRWIVLTHCHKDHAGSAAAIAQLTGAAVLASARDAPIIAGLASEPEAVITAEERPYYDRIASTIAPAPPVNVDHVLRNGDHLDGGLPNATVVDAPGHTPGSIALYLPDERVLFTGDNIASLGARPILGPFNVARDEAIESFRRLAALDIEIACFGHGDPLMSEAGTQLRTAARRI
jgi:glyoxylase-like metal-dependent hydrolase (beta-lactamase superfamily II)